mgnify:CR=1 FL=1
MSPKVGTVEKEQIRDSVWAASARTLTAFAAEELFDIPIFDSLYTLVTISSGAVANAFGSWVQISANIGSGKRLIGLMVNPRTPATQVMFEVEAGEGAAAAEAAVARVLGLNHQVTLVGFIQGMYFPVWKSLSDNARISCRVRDNVASAYEYEVVLMVA